MRGSAHNVVKLKKTIKIEHTIVVHQWLGLGMLVLCLPRWQHCHAGAASPVGVEQRRNRKLIQKPKFRFLDQTFGFCRFRFRRKQKDSGEESRKIIFFAFILESENKILPLIQKSEFNILLSLSKINAKKIIFLLSSPESFCFRRNRNLQKPKV